MCQGCLWWFLVAGFELYFCSIDHYSFVQLSPVQSIIVQLRLSKNWKLINIILFNYVQFVLLNSPCWVRSPCSLLNFVDITDSSRPQNSRAYQGLRAELPEEPGVTRDVSPEGGPARRRVPQLDARPLNGVLSGERCVGPPGECSAVPLWISICF